MFPYDLSDSRNMKRQDMKDFFYQYLFHLSKNEALSSETLQMLTLSSFQVVNVQSWTIP